MAVDPFDVAGFASLAVLAAVFGLLPGRTVMTLWIRMRQQVALLWTVACLHRGAEAVGLKIMATAVHQASAVVATLVACSALHFLARGVSHGRRR